MTTDNLENSPEFLSAFWTWFDNLPVKQKETFWFYSYDMAKTHFYFKVFIKIENK